MLRYEMSITYFVPLFVDKNVYFTNFLCSKVINVSGMVKNQRMWILVTVKFSNT